MRNDHYNDYPLKQQEDPVWISKNIDVSWPEPADNDPDLESVSDEVSDSSDKFAWKAGDLVIDKLVYKGVEIDDMSPQEFGKMSPEEKNAYISRKKELDNIPMRSGFDCPVYGEIENNLEGTILKCDKDLIITALSPEQYAKEPKKPVQAFVCNIVFPKSLDEVLVFSKRGCYNVEDILYEEETTWTVPNWAKIGDIVFFMHSKTAIQTIRKLCTALKNTDKYNEEEKEELQEWLDRGRKLYNEYGGKIYAYGCVSGNPEGMYEEDEDRLSITHWKSRIYADIEGIWALENPVDISEFNSFLFISRLGSITPVYGAEFEKLKALILRKNQIGAEYFIDATAAPVPLAKINDTNWLSVANEYRRSFLLEHQFRSFYVDRFLVVLGDRKRVYRECRCKKAGIPDCFVDNIIVFNGKYLPVEVKLNVHNEVDLPGQVKKYCNDDFRFTDHTAEKTIDNQKSYMNHVLIIDTENLYLYDDRTGQIDHIKNLDEITTVENIKELRALLEDIVVN